MKKFIFYFLYCSTLFSQSDLSTTYSNEISSKELKELLYVYASDYFGGREVGSKGQKIAVDFLREFYIRHSIDPAKGTDNYFQYIKNIKTRKYYLGKQFVRSGIFDSENVVSIIPGSKFPNEYIVISAHLDAQGTHDGKIYNGADDDGSGNVSILEIAESFAIAVKDGHPPKRSIIFLHVTAEEKGLIGSKYYVDNPLYPLKNTIANLNIDMIGRIDPKRKDEDPNYIYLIGSDKISQELHNISEKINSTYTQLKLDYKYNDDKDPNRFYYRSDHYNFAKNNIPVIFYFNGVHEDYHEPTDTADKINYELLEKRTKLIFHTAWELANREKKLSINK
ncbi:MAG: peptidase M28 [Flavobacteriaceae bacterium]|nr:peptidase M28 [Flavobacteriaceae bacterium]